MSPTGILVLIAGLPMLIASADLSVAAGRQDRTDAACDRGDRVAGDAVRTLARVPGRQDEKELRTVMGKHSSRHRKPGQTAAYILAALLGLIVIVSLIASAIGPG